MEFEFDRDAIVPINVPTILTKANIGSQVGSGGRFPREIRTYVRRPAFFYGREATSQHYGMQVQDVIRAVPRPEVLMSLILDSVWCWSDSEERLEELLCQSVSVRLSGCLPVCLYVSAGLHEFAKACGSQRPCGCCEILQLGRWNNTGAGPRRRRDGRRSTGRERRLARTPLEHASR